MATTIRTSGVSPIERLAPLSGVAVVPLALAGLILWEGPADRPEFDAAPGLMLTYFRDQDAVILGGFLFMLAAVAFLWFTGSLRAALREFEGASGRLSALAYAGGVITTACMLVMPGANVLGAVYADQLSPMSAQIFFLFANAFLYPAAMAAAVLTGATGLAGLRTGALPRAAAWLSLLLALWLLIPPIGAAAGDPENAAAWTAWSAFSIVPLWTAGIAIVLWDRDRTVPTADATAPPARRPHGSAVPRRPAPRRGSSPTRGA